MANIQYFENCTTQDEAKNLFKKLCFELHPDHSTSATAHADFIEMKKQYDSFRPSEGRQWSEADKSDNLYNIIRNFDKLENVLITFVGSFIWLEDQPGHKGSTKAQKEIIKTILLEGFNTPRFSKNRLKWFYSPEGYKQKFKSRKSFDEIRKTWGSKTYKPKREEVKAIA